MKLKLAAPLLIAVAVAGCNGEPAPVPYDVKALMATDVQPTAQIYWNAVQYVSDAAGLRKIEPKNDAEWARTRQAAAKLREYAEQLKSPAASAGRGTDWSDYAQGLADVAVQAEQAAKERDPDKVFAVGGSIYNVCSACHEVYMPLPGGAHPAAAAPSSNAK
jgi:cytochrome c556